MSASVRKNEFEEKARKRVDKHTVQDLPRWSTEEPHLYCYSETGPNLSAPALEPPCHRLLEQLFAFLRGDAVACGNVHLTSFETSFIQSPQPQTPWNTVRLSRKYSCLYTQVCRASCTWVTIRALTRISSGLTQLKYSSPSFGSLHTCFSSDLQLTIVCLKTLKKLLQVQDFRESNESGSI